jgi:colicin import membrane protein
MRTGLTVSTAIHAGLIALAIVGLGFGKPIEATPVESIAVDLVPITDVTNVRKGDLNSTVVDTEAPSVVDAEKPAEVAQPTGNTTEDQPTPEKTPDPSPAPTVNTAPAPEPTDPAPTPEPVEETAPVPAARPPAAEPVAQPEPEPVAEPEPAVTDPPPLAVDTPDPVDATPKPIVKTAALAEKRAQFKKQQDDAKAKAAADAKAEADAKAKADADAKAAADAKKAADEKKKADDAKKAADKKKADEKKRIEQAKADQAKQADDVASIINNEQSRGAVTGDGGEKSLGKEDGRSATLSQSQIDGLVAQIRQCISVPAGAAEAGSEAQLLFTVGGDGMVVGRPQLVSQTGDSLSTAYTGAVTRAVMRCGPYMVVAGQDVKATFRAKDF